MIELILELIRPIGNFVSRRIFSEKLMEADSIMSDAVGGIVLVVVMSLIVFLLVSYVR